jgi:hypothetical protein
LDDRRAVELYIGSAAPIRKGDLSAADAQRAWRDRLDG